MVVLYSKNEIEKIKTASEVVKAGLKKLYKTGNYNKRC